MAFDIYGERLQPGHCEVHPWVHCEYPCPKCLAENDERNQKQLEERRYAEDMERDYEKYCRIELAKEQLREGLLEGCA